MTTPPKDAKTRVSRQAGGPAAPSASRRGWWGRCRPGRRACLVTGGYALAAAFCGLAVYLWRAPLPPLPVAPVANEDLSVALAGGRSGAQASLEACLRQVKMRELFKPSVPIPTDDRLGKSTAQELADRLQFVGIMEEAGTLAALVFIPNRGPGTFRPGDRVAEFVLKDVQPDRLILTLGDEEAILKR
jgi:hypothetical protein